jgi:WD40 repeat protein
MTSTTPSPPRTEHVVLSAHRGPVHVATYSKGTAKYILSGGQDRSVRLWNASSGAEIKAFSGHGYEVLSISVYAKFPIFNIGFIVTHYCSDLTIMRALRRPVVTEPCFCGMLQRG